MSTTAPDAASRELELVGKVELRFALADTDKKLETLLGTYLTPLLLKLESPNERVREKVVKVIQHLRVRIQPKSIKLPVTALLKQFKEHDGALLRQFDLMYIQQGLERMPPKERVDLLPVLLDGLSALTASSDTRGSLVFNLALRILPLLQFPARGSTEDVELRTKFGFSERPEDASFVSLWLGRLILFTLQGPSDSPRCPGLSASEYRFLSPTGIAFSWDQRAEGGQNLAETKVVAAKFLASGVFTDSERFLPALFASADSNARISDVGEDVLKRFTPDKEDPQLVGQLFQLISGSSERGGTLPARPRLQARILSFLSRSKVATTFVDSIISLIDIGLLSPEESQSNLPRAQGLEASKLRTQIFSFISWAARIGEANDLQKVAPIAVTGLRSFIESQGWPNPASTGQKLAAADLSLRSNAYETIGILAPKLKEVQEDEELDLLRWLFTSLGSDSSGDQIFLSIEQALGSILNAYSGHISDRVQGNLRDVLTHQMTLKVGEENPTTGYKVVRSTRYAAVRFANRCLPYSDVNARWIDLIAVGGGPEERHEVIEEGRKGLDPYWYRMFNPRPDGAWLSDTSQDANHYPRYKPPVIRDLFSFLFLDLIPSVSEKEFGRFSGSNSLAFGPALSFCRNILIWEALDSSKDSLSPSANWENELDAAISTNQNARSTLKKYLRGSNGSVVEGLLHAFQLGFLRPGARPSDRTGERFVELCSLSPDPLIDRLTKNSDELLNVAMESNDRQNREMASHAYGIIASNPKYERTSLEKDLRAIISRISSWKAAIGRAVNATHGAILSGAFIIGRLAIRQRFDTILIDLKQPFIQLISEILLESRDAQLRAAAHTALGQLSIFAVLNPRDLTPAGAPKLLVEKLIEDAKKEQEKPIIALGRFALSFSSTEDEDFKFLIQSLHNLWEIRRPEVQFAVGEALATATAKWSSKSLMTALDVNAETPDESFNGGYLSEMVDKILEDCRTTKPALKKASAIWLLCMTQYCGHLKEIQDRLRKFQATFGGLLSDRDEVVQETGSRGLSLVYEMGDKELKDSLVRDLVKSFTSTNASMGGTVSEDTELFDPGALPTGDGSVTTYKDIMSLASEVGDPSLVYRFMTLASNNAIWSSRAAFGRFGLSNVLSDSSINGYLAQNPKLYPVLFRYKHDPNPNVQRSMNEIWSALVKDPNAVIDQNFDAIMKDLLKSILGREWRVRQASCAAISDLVQGREIDQLEKYLHEIWAVSFKVMDDIKETVRVAAMSLCQVLTNLLIRTLEMGDSSSKRSQVMLENVLPFLLSSAGLDASAKEVQAYAIRTLLKIIKKAPSKSLGKFIPQILEKLIGSLSSLEPEEVNYIHLNADKYGMTGNQIDNMRLSSIRTSPMMEAIERCLDGLDADSMNETVSGLEDSLRSAVGLPSKVGCSRVIVSLSTRQNVLFRPYADRVLQLLRKLVLDRNDTVSASYSSAIGYLMRLATDKQVLQTVEFSKSLYFDSEEANHRSISGEVIYSTSKLSNDRFMSVATAALPFVFIAKHDSEQQVKDLFVKVWSDNVGGSRAVALYLQEICRSVSGYLNSPRWVIKHASALAVAELVTSFEGEIRIQDAQLMWRVLEPALAGKTWEGKEEVLKAFVQFTHQSRLLWGSKSEIGDQMKTVAFREAKRTNQQYRKHALRSLGQYAQVRDDRDLSKEIFQIVGTIVDESLAEGSDDMEIDSGPATATTETVSQEILASAVDCLFRCMHAKLLSAAALTARLQDALSMVGTMRPRSSNSLQIALFEGAKLFFEGLDQPEQNTSPRSSTQNISSNSAVDAGGQLRDSGDDDDGLVKVLGDFARQDLVGPTDFPEHIRAKQAEAWLAFAACCQRWWGREPERDRTLPQSLSWMRQSTLAWLNLERSGPIQQTLRLAFEKLDSLVYE